MKMKFKAFSKAEMESYMRKLDSMGFLENLDAIPRSMEAEKEKQDAIIELFTESGITGKGFYEYMNLYNYLARFYPKVKAYASYNYYLKKAEQGEYDNHKYKDITPYILWYGNMGNDEIISIGVELEEIMIDEAGITKDLMKEVSALSNLDNKIAEAKKEA